MKDAILPGLQKQKAILGKVRDTLQVCVDQMQDRYTISCPLTFAMQHPPFEQDKDLDRVTKDAEAKIAEYKSFLSRSNLK